MKGEVCLINEFDLEFRQLSTNHAKDANFSFWHSAIQHAWITNRSWFVCTLDSRANLTVGLFLSTCFIFFLEGRQKLCLVYINRAGENYTEVYTGLAKEKRLAHKRGIKKLSDISQNSKLL